MAVLRDSKAIANKGKRQRKERMGKFDQREKLRRPSLNAKASLLHDSTSASKPMDKASCWAFEWMINIFF